LSIDYLTRNQDNIDYDVANITCELLVSKHCYIECCYFVEALLEQEREFGGIQKEENYQRNKISRAEQNKKISLEKL